MSGEQKLIERICEVEVYLETIVFTKSDEEYHFLKQKLHKMWVFAYNHPPLSGTPFNPIERINRCLSKLDEVVEKNCTKKYQLYHHPCPMKSDKTSGVN